MAFPKTLYVIADGADQATHMGHAKVNEIVVRTDEPTLVAVYRLVEEREYISVEVAKRIDTRKAGTQ